MKRPSLIILSLLAAIGVVFAVENTQVRPTDLGYVIGETASQKVGFFGATPVVQQTGSGQAALTNSTTGTASSTLAAGVGVQTITIPVYLSSVASGDVLTNYTPGFAGKLLSISFAVSKPATTASKAATLNVEIDTTDVTGGTVALTTASCDTLGELTAGSSITAANTFTAAQTISVEASSVTAFVEGEGYLLLKVQNMDTANAAASLATQGNALRTALVALGLIAGS